MRPEVVLYLVIKSDALVMWVWYRHSLVGWICGMGGFEMRVEE